MLEVEDSSSRIPDRTSLCQSKFGNGNFTGSTQRLSTATRSTSFARETTTISGYLTQAFQIEPKDGSSLCASSRLAAVSVKETENRKLMLQTIIR
jgi:hypothetical protein